jgi:hypothetical protein
MHYVLIVFCGIFEPQHIKATQFLIIYIAGLGKKHGLPGDMVNHPSLVYSATGSPASPTTGGRLVLILA